jgi:hypothetical protein
MDNIDNNISLWETKFNRYIELEALCASNINSIIEIKKVISPSR